MVVGGHRHAPAALPPGKTRYQLYRRLGRPQSRSGRVWKISPLPPGFDQRTVQSVASNYTVWAFLAPKIASTCFKWIYWFGHSETLPLTVWTSLWHMNGSEVLQKEGLERMN